MAEVLRLMVIGAHPDDAEYKAGGLAALYRQLGHEVLFVSVTNGEAGHHQVTGTRLAQRRKAEASAAGAVVGLQYDVWNNPDGRLEPSMTLRLRMIRVIRKFQPDLVLTHRPCDYHADHRATSLLVQDAAYLLTVPALCADVPYLKNDPVIAYLSDDFRRPYAFEPSVLVDISQVWDEKVAMLHAHQSQFYEWLPFNAGHEAEVPQADDDRRAWLSQRMQGLSQKLADRFRPQLLARFGEDRGNALTLIEAFEACEYGAPLDARAIARLFPFASAPRD